MALAAMGAARCAVVAMAVLVTMVGAGEAQDTSCEKVLGSVTGCASFLTNPSVTPDAKSCCQPLQSVLTTPTSLQCLCAQASNPQSDAFKNALLLPNACKLGINVSEANCTSSSSSSTAPSSSGTPTTQNTTSLAGSGGSMSAFPYAPFIIAIALLLCCFPPLVGPSLWFTSPS